MKKELEKLKNEFEGVIKKVSDKDSLEKLKNEFLGRKGKVKSLMKNVASLADEERKVIGKIANEIKDAIEVSYGLKEKELEVQEYATIVDREWMDVTQPGTFAEQGHLHPVTKTIYEIEDIFSKIGFTRIPVPEVDWDHYAFETLNMPKDHPARDDWETFFIDAPEGKKGKLVVIPHVSNVQVRAMEDYELPFRALYIGRSYRRQ